MFFSKIFNRNQPEIGIDRAEVGYSVLPKGAPVCSDPRGIFSMYIADDAMALIESEGKLTREEVESLPDRVYETVKALGLARKDPVHFTIELNPGRLPTESPMSIAKISPPIQAPNGDLVARTLLIFVPPFRHDMHEPENEIAKHLDGNKPQTIQLGFIQTRRTHCVTSLCHELVHLFVTDEYMTRFKGWSLNRLELLTDALTVAAVYPIVERSQDDFVKIGFIHGAAYLSNEIRKTHGDGNPQKIVEEMLNRTIQIIGAEKKALGV